MKKRLHTFFAVVGVLFVLFFNGCALRTPTGSKSFVVESPQFRQAALAKIKFWTMRGAFSIQQTHHRPEIASYVWQQSGHRYHISILSTLDLYRVDIEKTRHVVKLWKNGALTQTAKTPEGLLQEAMGWSLPVNELQWWIKGMPAPQKQGKFYTRYDQYGHLIELKQASWKLVFKAYKRQINVPDFPQSILLTHPGITVKIVVTDRLIGDQ